MIKFTCLYNNKTNTGYYVKVKIQLRSFYLFIPSIVSSIPKPSNDCSIIKISYFTQFNQSFFTWKWIDLIFID